MAEVVIGALIPWQINGTVEPLRTPDNSTLDGRIEWLQIRRTGLGSSDASAVLGMGRTTPHTLWLDKTGQMPLDLADNEAMEWGRRLEPIIRQAASERLGFDVVHLPPMLRSKEHPWMISNLDGAYYEHDAILECKNQTEWLRADWDEDQVPDHAELQVIHSLAVTGASHGYVAGLLGGNRLRVVRVDRDEELIEYLIGEERKFWEQYVIGGERPPVTYRDSPDTILGAADVPTTDVLDVDLAKADEFRRWQDQLEESKIAEKQAQERKREATNNILALAGLHELVVGPDGEPILRLQRGVLSKTRFMLEHPEIADVTMKKIETLDLDALKNEHPDLYRQYQSRSVKKPTKKDLAAAAARREENNDGA